MIKVYQIQLTDEEYLAVRNNGKTTPRIQAYLSRSFDSMFKAENFEFYTHVANVHTDDMEDAFRAMNLWEGVQVDRLVPCSSMSVGDILELEDGSKYRCASFGFIAL
jgi:hypothetical protein